MKNIRYDEKTAKRDHKRTCDLTGVKIESGRDDGKSIFVVEYCAVCVDCWWQLKREETEVI